MTARFCRHMNMLYIAPPAKTVLNAIFAVILGGHLAAFDQAVQVLPLARNRPRRRFTFGI